MQLLPASPVRERAKLSQGCRNVRTAPRDLHLSEVEIGMTWRLIRACARRLRLSSVAVKTPVDGEQNAAHRAREDEEDQRHRHDQVDVV
jgi:hypothetical protein